MRLRPLVPELKLGQFVRRRAWPIGVYVSMGDTTRGAPFFTPVMTDGRRLDDWCIYTPTAADFIANDWEFATP